MSESVSQGLKPMLNYVRAVPGLKSRPILRTEHEERSLNDRTSKAKLRKRG